MIKYLALLLSFLFISCATPQTTPTIMEKTIDQSLCQKAEECTIKMVDSFNIKDLKDQADIEEMSCNILAFACTSKGSVVMLRIHIKGKIQGQCINSTISVEGGIEYDEKTDKCNIKVKSTTYDSLEECNENKSYKQASLYRSISCM